MEIRYSDIRLLFAFLTSGERIKGREYRFYLRNGLLCYTNTMPDESLDEEVRIRCDFESDFWNVSYNNEVIFNQYMLYTILGKLHEHIEIKNLFGSFDFACFDRMVSVVYIPDIDDYLVSISLDKTKSPS